MKDAFQKEHEGEDENDWMIGPKGTRVMTPDALQRKSVRDRAVSEEVRSPLSSSFSPSCCLVYVACIFLVMLVQLSVMELGLMR